MFGLGMGEILIVLLIGLFLFGPRLPNIARSVGRGVVDFKKEVQQLQDDVNPMT